MTNSHLLAFTLFAFSLLLAGLTLFFGFRHGARAGWTRRQIKIAATCFVVGGGLFSGYAFHVDHGMRVITLHESMVEGTLALSPNASAPVREVRFSVEHPNVEHTLFLSPSATVAHPPAGPVELSFRLTDDEGQPLLVGRDAFRHTAAGRNSKADWQGKSYAFTPVRAVPHRLAVTPLTLGIPKIHVRVTDPLKRDGERMPGY